jgi:hypothetical protein
VAVRRKSLRKITGAEDEAMNNNHHLITIGYHKGELDFGVNSSITELSLSEMKELREMIIVAIYVAEDMWRREAEKKNPAQTVKP